MEVHFIRLCRQSRILSFQLLLLFVLNWHSGFAVAAERPVYPIDVAANKAGAVFIADLKLPGIWKFEDGKLEIVHQASKKFRTPLNAIRCIRVNDEGVIFAGDSATRNVYQFDENWKATPVFKDGPGIPSDILFVDDDLYVADLETQRIWKSTSGSDKLEEAAVVSGIRGLAAGKDKSVICITTIKDSVRTINGNNEITTTVKGRPFQFPHQAEVIDDQVFVADNYAGAIWKFPVDGSKAPEKFVSGQPLKKPVGLGLHKDGLLVADPHAKQIFLVSKDGKIKALIPE